MIQNIENIEKCYIAIEYPAKVNNIDAAFKTLGGEETVRQLFEHKTKKLPLTLHPENIFAKAAIGEQNENIGIILKVKIRRPKNKDKPTAQSVSILGRVEYVYRFNTMCDFQYLPIDKNATTGKVDCIYNDLIPDGIKTVDWLTSCPNVPFFLPPVSFTRIDGAHYNLFRKALLTDEGNDDECMIGGRRKRRIRNAIYLQFSLTDPIPTESPALEAMNEALKVKFVTSEQYNLVKELFDKRPVLTKMIIMYETHVSNDKLKIILPTLSFYYTTGPWRVMWVRYGYDPRKDFESRYYQQLDYRARTQRRLSKQIEAKRPLNTVKSSRITNLSSMTKRKEPKIYYSPYFEEGKLPESRQCIYQYCDIRVPKIQEMLDKIPTPLTGATCNEKSGWLPAGFDDQCREIINNLVQEQLIKKGEESEYGDDDELSDEDELDESGDSSDNDNQNAATND